MSIHSSNRRRALKTVGMTRVDTLQHLALTQADRQDSLGQGMSCLAPGQLRVIA